MTVVRIPEMQPVRDDVVQPFQLDDTHLRGRLVRLHKVPSTILETHAYPPVVAQLLGQAIAITTALASLLKYEGVFTLQTSGDGPVPFLVCDVTSEGHVRGYARYDADRLALTDPVFPSLVGRGYLAFTVDQGADTDRYQGIVPLEESTLADCIGTYFRQSEQICSALKVACAEVGPGEWRVGCLLLQQLPALAPDSDIRMNTGADREEQWNRGEMLLDTCTDAELLAPDLSADLLLYRLFHQDSVRVTPATPVIAQCRCSPDKVKTVLQQVPVEELPSLQEEDGKIRATCEFCGTVYAFGVGDL